MRKVDPEQVSVRFAEILLLVQRLAEQQRELMILQARLSRERDGKDAGTPKRFATMPRCRRR